MGSAAVPRSTRVAERPVELVQRISAAMTLYPGDIISCGTGPGALPMKPGAQIDIIIDGIGTLSNSYGD